VIAGPSIERAEDAGVYKVSDEIGLVQTIDFFTPIVDDPYVFGQIAAANALSDVYAMGARPLCAMNVVCFPAGKMEISVLRQVLLGGLSKVHEADAVLLGGHSIDDPEIKYGLAVTGIAHPDRIVTNSGASVGDRIVLTKPIGTGVISTAVKRGLATAEQADAVANSMSRLNRAASEIMVQVGPSACTDVTGFGLLGHLCEMMSEERFGIVVDHSSVPFLDGAVEFMREGVAPGGLWRNRKFFKPRVEVQGEMPEETLNLMFDAQTSGGLLIAVAESRCEQLLSELAAAGVHGASVIGEVVARPVGKVVVR